MSTSVRVACIQNNAGLDMAANLERLDRLIGEAAGQGAELAVTPEYGTCYGVVGGRMSVGAAPEAEHAALTHLRATAARVGIDLVIGSLAVTAGAGRIFNRSYAIDRTGVIRARYDKVHLFDVDLAGGESYRESDVIEAGDQAVTVELAGTTLGLSICYDLRFAALYRPLAQSGATILTVPAAFTHTTGKAHWQVLLQARAIETGSFVVAPCQCGTAPDGTLARYGHSLIIAPWGQVLADGGTAEGVALADLDLAEVAEARRMIPALEHNRPFTLARARPAPLAAAQ